MRRPWAKPKRKPNCVEDSMPTLVKPKWARKATTANFWGISFYCRECRRGHIIFSGARKKKVASSKLAQFTLMYERGEIVCGINPFPDRAPKQARLTVDEALEAFDTDQRAGRVRPGQRRAVSEDYAKMARSRLRRVLDACGARHVDALSTDAVNAALDRLQQEGIIATLQTRRHHESIVRSFGKWLCNTERLDRDPFRLLKLTYVGEGDTVHDRTAFTLEQLQQIVNVARSGPVRVGLTGEQRAVLFLTAAYTGLRAREAAAVRKQDFTGGMAQVKVAGMFCKNQQDAFQPVPSFMRPIIAAYVANLQDSDFLFPGGWQQVGGKWQTAGWVKGKAAGEFLRYDGARVGIVIGRKGKEQNHGVLDFHSLRHFYGTMCDRAQISDNLRRKLHRASTQKLLDRYTHRELAERTAAVEELPAVAWS
jgi:integrase